MVAASAPPRWWRGAESVFGEAPESVVVLFALVTQLGDAWFLFVAVAWLYWFAPAWLTRERRRVGATLVALSLAALAVTVGLKSLFALPRPPGAAETIPPGWLPRWGRSVYVELATGTGFGFPSGHALGTTVAYGGAAVLLDVWDRRRRVLAAGGVVALVALSRLVIGVHYLADVVVGVVVGVAIVAVGGRIAAEGVDRAFALAAGLGVVALAITLWRGPGGASHEAAATVGGGLGGVVGWRFRSDASIRPLVAGVALVCCGGLWIVVYLTEPPLFLTVALDALAVAGILTTPRLAGR